MSRLEPLSSFPAFRTRAINDLDEVVGNSLATIQSPNTRAILWVNQIPHLLPVDTGVVASVANDINDSTMVVGRVHNGNPQLSRAVWWQNDSMTELPSLGGSRSSAEGVNNRGDIVGNSKTSSGYNHPVIWKNNSITDLNPLFSGLCPSSTNCTAFAKVINDAGQIAGTYFIRGVGAMRGKLLSFRLSPTTNFLGNAALWMSP